MCEHTQESIYSAINLVWVLLDGSEGKFRDENISVTLENLEKSLKQNMAPLILIDYVTQGVWIPQGSSIFNDWTNHNLVTTTLYMSWTLM